MNILFITKFFYPHIGGIETVTEYLSTEFCRLGHKVTVITTTPESGAESNKYCFSVLRNPSFSQIIAAHRDADIVIHQGTLLRWIWPILLVNKPWVIVYHQVHFQRGIVGCIKRIVSKFAHAIAVSQTTKDGYGIKRADVIYNSYNSDIFKNYNHDGNRRDFVFVGKVSEAKGCKILVEAFCLFKDKTNSDAKLTFIGSSQDIEIIKDFSKNSKYGSDIEFKGFMYPEEMIPILNSKDVQIVPSLELEAFGVVVLEAMACGCFVIGSDGDGIAEAIGDAGFTFKKGDAVSLSQQMERAYNRDRKSREEYKTRAIKRLEKLSLNNIASEYIKCFNKYINS